MFYFSKTPWWLKKLYPSCIWDVKPVNENTIYLTFDDGPHPEVTKFVLKELDKYNAKATFFCIGNNVQKFPEVYKDVLNTGHAVGNHTFDHLNGWKTNPVNYLQNIIKAQQFIDSILFRPPYGRITSREIKQLKEHLPLIKIIMWDVLSGDFDNNISAEKCLKNVIDNAVTGSTIVFHDSTKAFENLKYSLPKVLQHFSEKGFQFKKLE